MTGKTKAQWGQLTDEDVSVISGRRDPLPGRLQQRYGVMQDKAERQIVAWQGRVSDDGLTAWK